MLENGLYDIYDSWYIPFWQQPWFIYIIIGCALGVAIGSCWLLYRLFFRKTSHRTAWQKAELVLHELQQKQHMGIIDSSQYYGAVTSIIKNYLYERYQYPILSSTDTEIVLVLKEYQAPVVVQETIQHLVEGIVTIKFAQEQAAQERMEKDFERCILLIKQTIPEQTAP